MKMIIAMVVMGACMAFAGEETNEAPVPLTFSTNVVLTDKRLKLTLEMERLNRSPYFRSWVNEFKEFVLNEMKDNVVGREDQDPKITLGAIRYHYRTNDWESFYLDFYCVADSPRSAFYLATNQVLLMVVDGKEFKLHASPKPRFFDYDPSNGIKTVTEAQWYPVPPQFLIMLGSAKKAQMRMETKNNVETRDLSRTNLARFAAFAKMCITSNSLNKVTMAEGAKLGN